MKLIQLILAITIGLLGAYLWGSGDEVVVMGTIFAVLALIYWEL